ncbi:sensor histidine kinase [Corynebacterium freiburgense]|uniref:sensor histidine kinase n=1 Tax=Corynebacterium freiburgense TaxID=556548 RepID=UPI001F0B6D05|nr:HAMP domain-containing sensor histidine kinase [Corynebacterium freiburgense]WJZ02086.1 Signal transduction histidine-protein kinase/phosphatase MprB [Corynebacterium freiburgense]
MILRTPSSGEYPTVEDGSQTPAHLGGLSSSRRLSLRVRLALVTAIMVAIAVVAVTIVAFFTVSSSLSSSVDKGLEEKATSLLYKSFDPNFVISPESEITAFKSYNPDIKVTYVPPGSPTGVGDRIQILDEFDVLTGKKEMTIRTSGVERILAKNNKAGATVILAQDLQSMHELTRSLGVALALMGAVGVLAALGTGIGAASAGLKPVSRLQHAVNYVAKTDDLRPISVQGNDELAQLTRSFNEMLAALQASRIRQTELVADAGHELKTPLTSLRTNIELLMMVNSSNGASISESDRRDLERDVIAQIDEMSTLIGDLVDLAREDGPQQVVEPLDLGECMETSLERVKRRRPDVTFEMDTFSWNMYGDPFALGRATLNLMDNAAKWSPPNGVVRIAMRQLTDSTVELTFADSGPGIPVEDREKVFERFYRSIQARSMPGSGLGLAIVKQVIVRHAGTIVAEESDDGGALMRVTLPGSRGDAGDAIEHDGIHGEESKAEEHTNSPRGHGSRKDFFAQLWEKSSQAKS